MYDNNMRGIHCCTGMCAFMPRDQAYLARHVGDELVKARLVRLR